MNSKLAETRTWAKEELERCVSFWLEHGMDQEYGGVITCLDREGKMFSGDKSVWMQGRCGWIFAYLCTVYGAKKEWLEASKSCIDFLEKYCHNPKAEGRLYFTVTRDGRPLRQRRYCFSEGFYCIANAEYYANTGDRECLEHARWAYDLIWKLNTGLIEDPVGMPAKVEPETRVSRAHADPMIFLNISLIMRRCDPENRELYDERARQCAETMTELFYRPELKCTLETVGPNGELQLDTVAGRVVNPGHDIEGSWFLEEEAEYEENEELSRKAQQIFRYAIEAGWDRKYGGILYFIDALGCPPESYEHDMKMWWCHNELLIASLKFYKKTGDEYYLYWFYKAVDYCKEHYCDPEYGEWFGYLRRDGNPTEPPCKGSTYKGPFHVPRSLIRVEQMLEEMGY